MPIVSRSTYSILLASEAARTEVQPLLTIGTPPRRCLSITIQCVVSHSRAGCDVGARTYHDGIVEHDLMRQDGPHQRNKPRKTEIHSCDAKWIELVYRD